MCSSSSPAAMNSSTYHRPAAARTSRQGSHQTVGGVQLRRAPVHAGRAYPDLLSLGRASSVHRQDLLRCLSASVLAGLPMSDRCEPRPEALPRESSWHGPASSSIEARRDDESSSAPQKYATRSLLLHALRTFRYRSARWGAAALGRALQRAPPPSATGVREAPPKLADGNG